MVWFRQHRRKLLQLTLSMWVLTLSVMILQGCLVQADHLSGTTYQTHASTLMADSHVKHASGCLQHCADTVNGINPELQSFSIDLAGLIMLLLLPALILFDPAEKIVFNALAVWRHVTLGPPARLRFVRLND